MRVVRSEFTFANPSERGRQAIRAKVLVDAAEVPLPGAIAMKDRDVMVIPERHTVDVDPPGPTMPMSMAK